MTRIIGSLQARAGVGIVAICERLDSDVDDVWSSITEPERLAGWFGEITGELQPGGAFRQQVTASGWTGTGRIVACERPHRLVVTIVEDDASWQAGRGPAPFEETIAATLTADRDATTLDIEITGLPLDKIAFYGAGWQHHTEQLTDYLAGRELRGEQRFEQLVPPYQELAAALS